MNGKLGLLLAVSALVLASTGCASRCARRCCPPGPAPCGDQPIPCQPPITRFTLTNDSGETVEDVSISINGQAYPAVQNPQDTWTAMLNVDDVMQATVNYTWVRGAQRDPKSETITLLNNTSTNPSGQPEPLILFLKTVHVTLAGCSPEGAFEATLDMEVGTPPRGLLIP